MLSKRSLTYVTNSSISGGNDDSDEEADSSKLSRGQVEEPMFLVGKKLFEKRECSHPEVEEKAEHLGKLGGYIGRDIHVMPKPLSRQSSGITTKKEKQRLEDALKVKVDSWDKKNTASQSPTRSPQLNFLKCNEPLRQCKISNYTESSPTKLSEISSLQNSDIENNGMKKIERRLSHESQVSTCSTDLSPQIIHRKGSGGRPVPFIKGSSVKDFLAREKDLAPAISGLIRTKHKSFKLRADARVHSEVSEDSVCPANRRRSLDEATEDELRVLVKRAEAYNREPKKDQLYILWIPFAGIFGFCSIVFTLGCFRYGNPLDLKEGSHLDLAYVCSFVWTQYLSLTVMSLVYNLLIARRFPAMNIQSIPFLHVRFAICAILAIPINFIPWYLIYEGFGTLCPFHFAWCALSTIITQGIFLKFIILPSQYSKKYEATPNLPYVITMGTIGLTFIGLIIPIILYCLILILFQMASKAKILSVQIIALILFRVARVILIELELFLFHQILGEKMDGVGTILAISIIGVLHYSFFTIILGSASDLVAVIFDVGTNLFFSIYTIVVMTGILPHMSGRLIRKMIYMLICGKVCIKVDEQNESEAIKEERLVLQAKDRLILLLRYLSQEVYKVMIPLTYLASVWATSRLPNEYWINGVGRDEWNYKAVLEDEMKLRRFSIQVMAMVGANACMVLVVIYVLRKLMICMTGALTVCCKEYGICLFSVTVFMLQTTFTIIIIHTGMDFTLEFNWLGKGTHYFDR